MVEHDLLEQNEVEIEIDSKTVFDIIDLNFEISPKNRGSSDNNGAFKMPSKNIFQFQLFLTIGFSNKTSYRSFYLQRLLGLKKIIICLRS